MNNVVSVSPKSINSISDENGAYGLFGFAYVDYVTKFSIDPQSLSDKLILGAILEPLDFEGFNFASEIEELYSLNDDKDKFFMFVFDINDVSEKDVNEVKNWMENQLGLNELKDVHEDRIVFVKEG